MQTETPQPPVIMMTHVRELLVSASGNLLKVQPLKEKHLDGLPLRFWERLQRFRGKPAAFLYLKPLRRPKARCLIDRTEANLIVQPSHQKVVSAIRAATIRVLQKPHFKTSSRSVELFRVAIKLQENGLREVLRFGGVAQYPQGRHMYQTMISLENHCERISIAGLKLCHEYLVV